MLQGSGQSNSKIQIDIRTQLDGEVVDLLPDFVIVIDQNGIVVEWNQQAQRKFGYSKEDAVGQSFADLLASDSFPHQSIDMIQTQLKTNTYWEGEVALNTKSGEHDWYFIRARRLTVKDSDSWAIIASTELVEHELHHHLVQAALDYSQKELSGILSAVGDVVCSYDIQERNLVFISPSCHNLTGYTEHELMDNPDLFLSMIVPEYAERVETTLRSLLPDQTAKIEYAIKRKDGKKRWVLNNMTPIQNAEGESTRVICAIMDTTAYREMNELKSRMMRMASHDLRNPLATAMNFFGLLIAEIRPQLSDLDNKAIEGINRAHERMATMLSELMNFEQLQAQESPGVVQDLDLVEIIETTIEEFSLQAQKKHHKVLFVKPDKPAWVKAERVQLAHAFGNYMSNAIKYTPTAGLIVTRILVETERVVVEVTDSGYGVPVEARDHLFTPFFRARQPGTEHIRGTGIGLSLVKSVINTYDGNVFYHPISASGSTFGFWLPLIAPPKTPPSDNPKK